MSLKWEVTEDVSEGLDVLQKRVSEKMKFILNEISYEFTGRKDMGYAPIPRRIGRYNWWLYTSGQTDSARSYDISPDRGEITINYSGMRYEEEFTEEEFKPWWEFAEDFDSNPYTAILERDYAYYQETGIDPVADEYHAKHKWAVTMGLLGNAYLAPKKASHELDKLLNQL